MEHHGERTCRFTPSPRSPPTVDPRAPRTERSLTHPGGLVTVQGSGSSGALVSLDASGAPRWQMSSTGIVAVRVPLADDLLYVGSGSNGSTYGF